MYSATIKSIEKTVFQVDNQTYLAVELEILKDGELVETRKLAFPLDTSEEAITAELAKYVATYADDQRLAALKLDLGLDLARYHGGYRGAGSHDGL